MQKERGNKSGNKNYRARPCARVFSGRKIDQDWRSLWLWPEKEKGKIKGFEENPNVTWRGQTFLNFYNLYINRELQL